MPRAEDNPEVKSTLPRPELNPILNPVLGANMGRWAEVYFTSPPEKREEAVLELLRELEGKPVLKHESAAGKTEQLLERRPEPDRRFSAEPEENSPPPAYRDEDIPQTVPCRSCGRANPAQYQFCGICGADIRQSRPLDPPVADTEERETAVLAIEDPTRDSAGSKAFVESFQAGGEPFSRRDSALDEGPKLLPDSEPAPYRYWIYFGAALAILVSVLIYTARRGTQSGVGASHPLPSAAPAATAEEPSQARTGTAQKADTEDPANTTGHAANEPAAPAPSREPIANDAGQTNLEANSVSATAPPSTTRPVEPVPQAQSAKGDGAEELAIGRNFLNGTHGAARDSTEAAKWLWKSVRKQNPAAALMLSDLYLHGNGVPKSCDQARLLLESAARKGAAGAAERLRNLPAFGCQ